MKAIDYQEILHWLGTFNHPIIIPTLGRRKTLQFWVADGIIYSKDSNGNQAKYTEEYWVYICETITGLPNDRREKTTEYSHLRKHYQSPGVPALCREYCNTHPE